MTEKSTEDETADEIVRFDASVFVTVMLSILEKPTTTLPNDSDDGFAEKPRYSPVPETEIVDGELDALWAREIVAVFTRRG